MKQLNNISTPKGRKVFSRRILFFSFFILAVIALALGLWLKRTMDQEIRQDNIEKEITTEKEKDGVRNLHKKYKDMIGWLEIKGTGFSYPVMQTGIKGHHEGDWQYYLHRDVHGDYSFYGTPFLDVRCKTDSDNLIIYGHNINGRRYFGYLQNFREETFFKEYPVFSFTPRGIYTGLLLSGELLTHCLEIQEQVEERFEVLTQQLLKNQIVTGEMKQNDPLQWTKEMNRIYQQAEEIVLKELVYQ